MLVRTNYAETPWIQAGKIYEAVKVNSGKFHGMYKIMGELGSPLYTRLTHSMHIGCQDWEIVKND